MNDSPMNTMLGNSMARGHGDSANRDMFSDTMSGPMGTMVDNGQGVTSNIVSGYNSGKMSDIEKNMMMQDMTRGYDTEGPMSGSGPGGGMMDYGPGPGGTLLSHSNGPGVQNQSMQSSMSMPDGGGMTPSLMMFSGPGPGTAGGPGGMGPGFNTEERQTFTADVSKKTAPQQIVIKEVASKSLINTQLRGNGGKEGGGTLAGTVPLPGGSGRRSSACDGQQCDEEQEFEERVRKNKEFMPENDLAGRTPSMRATEWVESGSVRIKKKSKEQLVEAKLQSLSNQDLEKLVEKTAEELNNKRGTDQAIAHCKMRKLRKEAHRRFKK